MPNGNRIDIAVGNRREAGGSLLLTSRFEYLANQAQSPLRACRSVKLSNTVVVSVEGGEALFATLSEAERAN